MLAAETVQITPEPEIIQLLSKSVIYLNLPLSNFIPGCNKGYFADNVADVCNKIKDFRLAIRRIYLNYILATV